VEKANVYNAHLNRLLDAGLIQLSDMLPSEWAEANRVMTADVSSRQGSFSYRYTPYLREVVDCLSPNNPAKIVSIEKGAQVGFSTGVIETGIGWIISQSPSNILFLTGHADLAEEAMSGKIDNLIHNSGIRHLIRSNSGRLRNSKTGDTNKAKEFPNGSLVAGAVGNHKLLRQRSVRYGFIDDFDAAKALSKESGATRKMVEQRFAAYASTKKIFYISTPELMETSNIHPVYIMGDQRKYHIPCPCCGELIRIEWQIPIDGGDGEAAGITWQLDDRGKLIKETVGYTCYKCAGWFDDSGKSEWLLDEKEGGRAMWIPTAEAFNEDYRSYHLSSLYAPAGMDGWAHYVANWMEANPKGQLPISAHMQTFTNLCLGLPWEDSGEKPQANQLQQNTRNYRPWTIPDALSEKDGNGRIVLLTMAIDLNGKVEDARADWEIVGWAESGASYSIAQGSIGTFVPKEKELGERARWTYDHNRPRSVWPEIERIMGLALSRDKGDRKMRVHVAGIDAPSHFAEHAYKYVDSSNFNVFALKGDGDRTVGTKADVSIFKRSVARPKLFLLDVNSIKDQLAQNMKLNHLLGSEDAQPVGFMNYPLPEMGMYTYTDFYQQYEAEERRIERGVNGQIKGMRWVKRSSSVQNHFWDCRVYNMALKDIFVSEIGRAAKVKDFTWKDWCDSVLNRKG